MITFDFETRSPLPLAGKKSVGSYRYALHPRTQVLCAAWLYDNEDRVGHWHRHTTGQGEWDPIPQSPNSSLEELIRRIEDGEPIEAHNAFFEQMVWELCWKRELPWLPLPKPEQWYCSAAKAASFALPRKLEVLCTVLGTRHAKDMEGHAVMLRLCKPARKTKGNPNRQWHEDPVDLKRNWEYNAKDVFAERDISGQLRPLSDHERQVWLLDQRMNRRGVYCDRDMVDAAIGLAEAEVKRMNAAICGITKGEVATGSARPSLKKWARDRGVALTGTGGDVIEARLAEGDVPKDVAEVLQMSVEVNKTSTQKFYAMENRVCPDGRIRDLMMYHGASTGRWAGTGLQPHNFPRGSIKNMEAGCEAILWKDPKTIEFLYGPVMGHLSSCARGAICAAPGRDLIVADYSAVEARDVFWLAKDAAGLEAFRASDAGEGPEVYCIMAEQIFGYPVDPSMEKERFVGKQTILGAGYGMGPDKYLDTCLKYGIRLPDDICKKAIGTYRDVHDPVKTMWAEQEAGAKLAVREKGRVITVGRVQWAVRGRFLHCKLPSGRLLSYYKPMLSTMLNFRFKVNKGDRLGTFSCNQKIRSSGSEGQAHKAARHRAEMVCKEMHWELTEDRPFVREQIVLRFYGQDSKTKKWKIHETYGGKLVENITQAVARDQLADSMVRMDAGGVYMMLLSVHDETVAEVDEGAGDLKEFEREMAVCSDWCADAPLVAKGWRGKRYRKA